MKLKKLFSLALILSCVFFLFACNENVSKDLWDRYVEAVNKQDLEEIAKTFYSASRDIDSFLEQNKDTYFNDIKKLETVKYTVLHTADFTDAVNVQAYYLAEVEVKINGSDLVTFELFVRSDNYGAFFCTEFSYVMDGSTVTDFKNEADSLFLTKMYYTTPDYLYKFNEKLTAATYVQNLSNTKEVIIPDYIDEIPVKTILRDSFLNVSSLLSFSITKSKIEKITIPETVEVIGERAFYQCNKLKEVIIPKSVVTIDRYAFASCSKVTRLDLLPETKKTENTGIEVESTSDTGLTILNARHIQVGQIIKLTVLDKYGDTPSVRWSIEGTNSGAKVDADTGEVTGVSIADATIVAKSTDGKLEAKVKIKVEECPVTITISVDAFNRMNSLKEVYIYASNPNSISLANASRPIFGFPSQVVIYVPRGSLKMYQTNTAWSNFKNNIKEM